MQSKFTELGGFPSQYTMGPRAEFTGQNRFYQLAMIREDNNPVDSTLSLFYDCGSHFVPGHSIYA